MLVQTRPQFVCVFYIIIKLRITFPFSPDARSGNWDHEQCVGFVTASVTHGLLIRVTKPRVGIPRKKSAFLILWKTDPASFSGIAVKW